MQFQSMSLVAGTKVCNAKCPFCVSRMTGMEMIKKTAEEINQRNLHKAVQLASHSNVTNIIITGKGEPTLYPEHINVYMEALDNKFPFVELQTNGSMLLEERGERYLKNWYDAGMTTIMISNCGYDPELNRRVYFPHKENYIDLPRLVDKIHDAGMIVRYTTVGIRGVGDNFNGIHSPEQFDKLVDFTKKLGIEQLTWRPVNKTSNTNNDPEINGWVAENGLRHLESEHVVNHVRENGTELYKLVHNGAVYDYKGQNVCLTNCLTRDASDETIRQLIFFPNGQLYTDWEFKGSRLL